MSVFSPFGFWSFHITNADVIIRPLDFVLRDLSRDILACFRTCLAKEKNQLVNLDPCTDESIIMRKVLARPWVGVQMCHLPLLFFIINLTGFHITKTISVYSQLKIIQVKTRGQSQDWSYRRKQRLETAHSSHCAFAGFFCSPPSLSSHYSLKFHFSRLPILKDQDVAFIYLYVMVPLVNDIDHPIQWSISSQMLTVNHKFQLVDDRFRLENLPVTSKRSLSWQQVRQSPLSHANPTRDIVHAWLVLNATTN